MYMKNFFKFFAIALNLSLSQSVVAEQIMSCLTLPSRVEPCPNLIYRGIIDPVTGEKKVFCFCKTDIANLFDDRVSDAQKALNKMEWRELVATSGYTEAQLVKMISR